MKIKEMIRILSLVDGELEAKTVDGKEIIGVAVTKIDGKIACVIAY